MSNAPNQIETPEQLKLRKINTNQKLTLVIYILQLSGFLFVLTWVAGIIINYIIRDQVRDTWLASHCSWQMRTFWYGLLWYIIGFASIIIAIGFAILAVNTIWLFYRIIKGFVYLYDRRAID